MAKKQPEVSAEPVSSPVAAQPKKVAIRFAEAVSSVDGSWAAGDVVSFDPATAHCFVKTGRAKLA